MVKIAWITIKDTGYINKEKTGTICPDIANAGNEINLKAEDFTYKRGASLDDNPSPGTLTNTNVNKSTVSYPTITISGIFSRTSSADMDLIPQLDKLVWTNGLKELYYNSTTDGYRDITDSLGKTAAQHNCSGISTPHFHIYIKDFTIRHTANKLLLKWTLECEVIDQ